MCPCRTSSAAHRENINTPLPPLRGPTWVRDRCRQVLCHACFHENDETHRFCQNCRCEAPRGCSPIGNDANRLQANETQLRTRYDQFRSFQRDKVGQRRKSAVADGFDKFMRSFGVGRRLPRNGGRVAMLPRFSRQRNYDRTRDFMPPGGTVFSLLLRPLARLHAAICVWITAKVLRIQA